MSCPHNVRARVVLGLVQAAAEAGVVLFVYASSGFVFVFSGLVHTRAYVFVLRTPLRLAEGESTRLWVDQGRGLVTSCC